jgi:predicted nuclease with TOPRIM domain
MSEKLDLYFYLQKKIEELEKQVTQIAAENTKLRSTQNQHNKQIDLIHSELSRLESRVSCTEYDVARIRY